MDSEFTDTAAFWGLRILYASAILGVGIWFALFVSRFVRRQADAHPRIDATLAAFLSRMIRYALILLVLIVVLQMFGVQTASLIAVLGAAALAIGLALQGTLGNVASGVMIAIVRPYRIGDFVEVCSQEGKVVDLDLFFTELATLDDRRVMVPNGQVVTNAIVNHTTKKMRRCVIVFGVGYDDDLDKVCGVVSATLAADPRTIAEPPPWIGVDSLGDFAVNVSARAWIKTDDYLDYRAAMIKAVKEAFDREGIEMPYPHAIELSKGEIEPRSPPIKPPLKARNPNFPVTSKPRHAQRR